MPTYRDEAVVLRTHKLGEADRIITVLSRHHGKVRAVARGVRRTSSKFGARLEPFSHVDVQFATGRSLDVITEVATLHPYSEPLSADYGRYTTGEVMLETADRLVSEEHQPSLQQFRLLVGALHALTSGTSDGPRAADTIMNSYLLRAIATAGFAPTLDDCAVCGTPGPHESFSPSSGGVVCRRCRPPGSGLLAPGALAYLSALISGDWPATKDVGPQVRRQTSGLVAAFVSWHLERGLRTLSYVDH
ncbi:DNA repair protein RecO [Nigerium massiliense]|uniref:DNA repair protein RecO n=1 Tax=Nigerium massiliense TaxID=1522317 RepID=UPI0005901293|nr:DNA repair protein RecO [Nigerium massiliense]